MRTQLAVHTIVNAAIDGVLTCNLNMPNCATVRARLNRSHVRIVSSLVYMKSMQSRTASGVCAVNRSVWLPRVNVQAGRTPMSMQLTLHFALPKIKGLEAACEGVRCGVTDGEQHALDISSFALASKIVVKDLTVDEDGHLSRSS